MIWVNLLRLQPTCKTGRKLESRLVCASLVPPSLPQNLLPCPSCCRTQQRVALSCAVSGCFAPNAARARESRSKGLHQTKSFATPVAISKPHFPFAEDVEGREKCSKPKAGSEVQSWASKRVCLMRQRAQKPTRATPPCKSGHLLSERKMASRGLQHRGGNQRAFEGLKTRPTRSPPAWQAPREVAKTFHRPVHKDDTLHAALQSLRASLFMGTRVRCQTKLQILSQMVKIKKNPYSCV